MAMSEARSGPSSQRRGPLGELGAEYHGELGHGGLLAGITAGLGTMMQGGQHRVDLGHRSQLQAQLHGPHGERRAWSCDELGPDEQSSATARMDARSLGGGHAASPGMTSSDAPLGPGEQVHGKHGDSGTHLHGWL